MINEEKVKLMTKVASYETGTGREDIRTMSYFRGDYVSFNVFITLLGVTVSLIFFFLADLGEHIFGNLDQAFALDFTSLGAGYLTIWTVFMVVYGITGTIIYRNRYNEASFRVERYQKWLKDIIRMSPRSGGRA